MKTSKFIIAAILAFTFATLLSACSDSEDPTPDDPNQPPTNLPGTGLPGGGDTGNPGNPGNPGDSTGGGQQPEPSSESLGTIIIPTGRYEFPEFLGVEAASQANDAGAYPIDYYYADEDAANDQDGDDNLEGVVTIIRFNAEQASVVEPGQYPYQVGSQNANEFSFILLTDHDRTYLLQEARIQIASTNSDAIYGVVFEGQGVEIEIVNDQINIVSDPFDMEGSFLIPSSLSQGIAGRRAAPRSPKLPDFLVAF